MAGDRVDYNLVVSAHDLAIALGMETDLVAPVPRAAFEARQAAIDSYLTQRLTVRADGQACAASAIITDFALLPQEIGLALTYRCTQPIRELTLGYGLFFELDRTHRALGRLILPGGEEEFLFDRSLTRLDVTVDRPKPPAPWLERATRLVMLGIEHILSGADHVLFLVALLIGARGFWPLVQIVTAFTIAHSLTLGLAWFGVIDLPGRLVEVAIALSIVYVALGNILSRNLGHRWALAGGFGLVHGLGFYAALRDLELAREGVVTTLLGFNIGVELGQLAIVAVVYGPLTWAARRSWYPAAAKTGSAAIVAVAGWWTLKRLLLS